MANIYCSKKLEKLVGKKLIESEPTDHLLGNWNASIFPVQRRKCLILVNDVTFYSILFLDILKKDMLNLHEHFYLRFIEQLDYDQIDLPLHCAPKLMDELKPRFLRTNNNRSVLGTINEFIYDIDSLIYHMYNGQLSEVN